MIDRDQALWTASTVIDYLDCKPTLLRRIRDKNLITRIKISGKWRYPSDAADQFIQSQQVKPCQDERINYHASDVLALSILAQGITNKPLGQLFYENIYLDFRKQVGLHWTLKKTGA
jgi:predicted transcriptional regulator